MIPSKVQYRTHMSVPASQVGGEENWTLHSRPVSWLRGPPIAQMRFPQVPVLGSAAMRWAMARARVCELHASGWVEGALLLWRLWASLLERLTDGKAGSGSGRGRGGSVLRC